MEVPACVALGISKQNCFFLMALLHDPSYLFICILNLPERIKVWLSILVLPWPPFYFRPDWRNEKEQLAFKNTIVTFIIRYETINIEPSWPNKLVNKGFFFGMNCG